MPNSRLSRFVTEKNHASLVIDNSGMHGLIRVFWLCFFLSRRQLFIYAKMKNIIIREVDLIKQNRIIYREQIIKTNNCMHTINREQFHTLTRQVI